GRTRALARPRGVARHGGCLSADPALLPPFAPVGARIAGDRRYLRGVHPRFRLSIRARSGRRVEGTRSSRRLRTAMTTSIEITPTKTHRGENFPVASLLIAPRHRGPILAFYRFVRAADDVADHPSLSPSDKFALMDRLEDGLLGKRDDVADALPLRAALAERGLSPRHAQDLLTAFRIDVTKLRYTDSDDLLGYCAYSANPVGRFVLDVHGEDRGLWPANDALCTALQIINHLQDCGKDYRALNRVYIPLDAMARCGMAVEE